MPEIGSQELVVIVFVLFFLFGGKKIPEMMKDMGSAVGEFKKGLKEDIQTEDKKN